MRNLLLVLFILLVGAAEGPRVQLRYHPGPGTAWHTTGTLAVKTWLKLPNQEMSESEVDELAWRDVVLSRDAAGTVVLQRTVELLRAQGTQENLVPAAPMRLTVSKLCELAQGGLLHQPALYPLRNVAPGESWPVEQTVQTRLEAAGKPLTLTTVTRGTGRLVRLEPTLATLEVNLTQETSGQNERVASKSVSQIAWTLVLEREFGVPVRQTVKTTTDQTVLLEDTELPSRMETTLELTTSRTADSLAP